MIERYRIHHPATQTSRKEIEHMPGNNRVYLEWKPQQSIFVLVSVFMSVFVSIDLLVSVSLSASVLFSKHTYSCVFPERKKRL